MGSSTPATTNTNSSSSPWSAATPLLQNLIGKYGGQSTAVTPGQTSALGNLSSTASSIPNFGATAAGGVNSLFSSSTAPQVGMLQSGYQGLQSDLSGAANPANINPLTDPGIGTTLQALNKNITNSVNGEYAGSGRDPSGAGSYAGSLATGLAQGEAPVITSQYNTDVANQQNAANTLYGAANTTASNITNQNQVPLQNILSGIQGAGSLSSLYTAPAAAQVATANASQAAPYQNLQELLTPSLGLGALGTNTTGTSTQTPANNPLMNIIGGATAGAGLLFSDIKLKENVRHVATMPSGVKLKSYNMKHDPFKTRQIGMIAQQVQKVHPEAVHRVGALKAVDYPKALQLGMIPKAA
jgi:hypothetical protein